MFLLNLWFVSLLSARSSQLWNWWSSSLGAKIAAFQGSTQHIFMKKLQPWGAGKTWEDALGDMQLETGRGCWEDPAEDMARDTPLAGGTSWWSTFMGLLSWATHSREKTPQRDWSCGLPTMEAGTPSRDCGCGWPISDQEHPSERGYSYRIAAMGDPCWGRGKTVWSKEQQTETIRHTTQNLLCLTSLLKEPGCSECNPQQKHRKLRWGREGEEIWLNVSPE